MTDNTDPAKGGAKYDSEKAPMDLLPWQEVTDVAMVLKFGAQKYDKWNWTEVNRTGRYIAAGFRHMAQFQSGEDIDPDSGLHHLAHAATNMLMALWLQKNHPERDDRYKGREGA